MKKHVVHQDELHKTIVRTRYLKGCNPIVLIRLMAIVKEHQAKGRGK